jgi:hypothetical protein
MDKHYNLEKLESLSGGDSNFIHQMVELFLSESESNCQKFEDDLAAGDFASIRSLAHKIKPTIDLMGIHPTLEELIELKEKAELGQDAKGIAALVASVNKGIRAASEDLKTDF